MFKNLKIYYGPNIIWEWNFKGQPALSVRITEQYFNANFNAHQNDFNLKNGNYEATFTRNVLDLVHDDANDGEYKNLRI